MYVHTQSHPHTYIHTHLYILVYIYVLLDCTANVRADDILMVMAGGPLAFHKHKKTKKTKVVKAGGPLAQHDLVALVDALMCNRFEPETLNVCPVPGSACLCSYRDDTGMTHH
jgi:hypothetical protein